MGQQIQLDPSTREHSRGMSFSLRSFMDVSDYGSSQSSVALRSQHRLYSLRSLVAVCCASRPISHCSTLDYEC